MPAVGTGRDGIRSISGDKSTPDDRSAGGRPNNRPLCARSPPETESDCDESVNAPTTQSENIDESDNEDPEAIVQECLQMAKKSLKPKALKERNAKGKIELKGKTEKVAKPAVQESDSDGNPESMNKKILQTVQQPVKGLTAKQSKSAKKNQVSTEDVAVKKKKKAKKVSSTPKKRRFS